MKKYSKEWNEFNKLISFIRSSDVVSLVEYKYSKYGNTAPIELLKDCIDNCEYFLNKAKEKK